MAAAQTFATPACLHSSKKSSAVVRGASEKSQATQCGLITLEIDESLASSGLIFEYQLFVKNPIEIGLKLQYGYCRL
jgi:hypothetical protein